MKFRIAFIALILSVCTAAAQQPATDTAPPAVPAYAYCQIIGSAGPTYISDRVLFDFGQATSAWAYNWLQDDEGRQLVFNSPIEALNYMVRQGWEFVQAYTSGKENQHQHLLLRIRTSRLTEAQLQQLLQEPQIKTSRKSN